MSGPQIKGLLEETVKEYSKIKGIFTNINSLPDYSDNPALIRSVEVIYENLNKIREEVVRFQGTLPPPTEGFNKSYKSPDISFVTKSTNPRSKKSRSSLSQTLPNSLTEADAKILNSPVIQFVNKFVCKNSGMFLLMVSAFAWIIYNIFKWKWGLEATGSAKGLLTCYFICMGFVLPALGFTFTKSTVCRTCGKEWLIIPFAVDGFETVTCSGCSSVLPISKELLAYRSIKFVLVLLPFYFTFLFAGPACFTIWGYLVTSFVVSYVLQQFLLMKKY